MPSISAPLQQVDALSAAIPAFDSSISTVDLSITQVQNTQTTQHTLFDGQAEAATSAQSFLAKLGIVTQEKVSATQTETTQDLTSSVTIGAEIITDDSFVDITPVAQQEERVRNKRWAPQSETASHSVKISCFDLQINHNTPEAGYNQVVATNNCNHFARLSFGFNDAEGTETISINSGKTKKSGSALTLDKTTLLLIKDNDDEGIDSTKYEPEYFGDHITTWQEYTPKITIKQPTELRQGINEIRLYLDNKLNKPVNAKIERCNSQQCDEITTMHLTANSGEKLLAIPLPKDYDRMEVTYTTPGGFSSNGLLRSSINENTFSATTPFARSSVLDKKASNGKFRWDQTGDGKAKIKHTLINFLEHDRLDSSQPELANGDTFSTVLTTPVIFRFTNKWERTHAEVAMDFNLLTTYNRFHKGPLDLSSSQTEEGYFAVPPGATYAEFFVRDFGSMQFERKRFTVLDMQKQTLKGPHQTGRGKNGICGSIKYDRSGTWFESFTNEKCGHTQFNKQNQLRITTELKPGIYDTSFDMAEAVLGETRRE